MSKTHAVIPAKAEIQENELPQGWVMTTLGKVTQPIKKVKPADEPQKEILYLDIGGIDKATNTVVDYKKYHGKDAPSRAQQAIKKGDIAFANVRPYLKNIAVVPNELDGQVGSTGFCFLRPAEGVENKYIFYWVLSNTFIRDVTKYQKGSSYPAVTNKQILERNIPLAPPEQQKRIVAKIEELFSHIDAGIEALKKAKQLLKQYRQSVLKAAVTGELTKVWREANKDKLEPASELLGKIEKQILATYKIELEKWSELVKVWEKSGSKEKKPPKPNKPKIIDPLSDNVLGKLHSLPDGWVWAKLSQVSTKITDGEHFKPPVQDHGVYFLSAKDVRDEGVSFENPLYISEETASKALLRCNPESGDILIVSRGATVGRMCVVNSDEVFCLLGSVILIKVSEGINSSYLLHLMKSPDVNKNIANVSGATAQQAIYLRDIQHVAIPLCTTEEQNQIEQIVGEKMDSIFRLEKDIETQLTMGEKNKQSILVEAFSGKLVEPLKGDEPASMLLENIRAKSKSVVVTKRGRSAEKEITKQEVSMRRPILDVLKESGGEIEAFTLMQKAGYEESEVEEFYYELGDISELIEEMRPSKTAVKRWPYTEAVSIKLRK